MTNKDINLFTELVQNLVDGKLSHNHIQMAYRDSIRKRTDIPDAIKDILAGKGDTERGLLAPLFKVIGQTLGGLELGWRRGYQAGYQDRVMGREPETYACTSRKDVRENER